MGLLRSKVAGIVFAAALVGGMGGTLAVLTAAQPAGTTPSGSAASLAANGSSASSSSGTATPTNDLASPGDSGTPTNTAVATAIPSPTATRTPRPTPTLVPFGQTITLRGSVSNISRNADGVTGTFVLNVSGRLYTCDVTTGATGTTWPTAPAPVTSFAALRSGMFATVTGSLQTDGTFVASSVNAQADN